MRKRDDDIEFSIVKVGPDTARDWLALNTGNRHTSETVITRYAQDMRTGNWLLTAEPIKFDQDGHLLDGQHRLLAIVKANVTVEMVIARGLFPETGDVMDTGRKRTSADALARNGMGKNANLVAGAASVLIAVHAGRRWQGTKATTTEILTFVDQNPALVDVAALSRPWSRHIDVRPAVLCAAAFDLLMLDEAAASEFFERLSTGADLSSGNPILTLRNTLIKARRIRRGLPPEAYLSAIYRAWNAWRDNRAMRILRLEISGSTPEIPTPH